MFLFSCFFLFRMPKFFKLLQHLPLSLNSCTYYILFMLYMVVKGDLVMHPCLQPTQDDKTSDVDADPERHQTAVTTASVTRP